MITFKRYLLTLVALLAMTTGAWADEPKVYNSAVAFADLKVGDILAEGFSLTNTEGIQFYLTANRFKENGTPRDYGGSYYASSFGALGANGALSDGYNTYTPVTDQNEDGNAWKIESIPFEKTLQLVGITYDVPTPLMSLSSDGLSATMAAMPACDATVSYQLVRDMAQGVAFSGLPEGDGCILKKDGDKYTFATAPTIALEDNISGTAQAITAEGITLSYEKKGEGDTWVAQPDDFDIAIDAVPGTYRVVAKATTGLYDGTLYSPEFTLYQGYEVTVPAGEYITYYRTDDNLVLDAQSTDAKLYTITAVSGSTATATEIASANKEMPFLVYNSNTSEAKTFLLIPTDTEINQAFYTGFKGTTEAKTTADTDSYGPWNMAADKMYYAFNGKQFVWVKNALAVGANKAWLEISTGMSAGAPAINLVFGNTTGVSEELRVNSEEFATATWYDLNGRKLQGVPTKKGIYIMNGKKVVIK